MALDADLQSAYSDAWNEQAAHLGDEITVGALTVACVATIIDESVDDEIGGDRKRRQARVQVSRSDLTAGVPALFSTVTYRTLSWQIEGVQKSDDEVTVTFTIREDL